MPTSSKNGRRSRGRTGKRWDNTRRRILRSTSICALCGELVDQTLSWPDPWSPSIDHIIPLINLDGPDDPRSWDIENCQLAHLKCNQEKGAGKTKERKHPTSRDWTL